MTEEHTRESTHTGENNEERHEDNEERHEEQSAYRSQEEFDSALSRRLERERKKIREEIAAEAEAEAKKAKMEETERLRAEKEEAEAKAAQREQAANERLIASAARVAALTAGARPERVGALLKLADLSDVTLDDSGEPEAEALKTAVDVALKEYPEFKAAPSNVGGGGSRTSSSENGVTAESFRAMSYADRVALYNRDPDLYRQLSAGG